MAPYPASVRTPPTPGHPRNRPPDCATYPLPHLLRAHRLIEQRVLPDAEQHQEGLVARDETREEVLLRPGADEHRVGYYQRRLLLRYGGHVLPFQRQVRAPPEDVRVKAEVVLRDVQAPVDEDLLLEGAGVICKGSGWQLPDAARRATVKRS